MISDGYIKPSLQKTNKPRSLFLVTHLALSNALRRDVTVCKFPFRFDFTFIFPFQISGVIHTVHAAFSLFVGFFPSIYSFFVYAMAKTLIMTVILLISVASIGKWLRFQILSLTCLKVVE